VGRAQLLALSLGAHAVLGVCLGSLPQRRHRETIAITMADTKKPKVPPKIEAVSDPDPPRSVAPPHAVRAKAAPTPKPLAPPAAPTTPEAAAAQDSLPDFGLSLSGGGPGGVAVPAAARPLAGPAPPVAVAKTLSRSAGAPRPQDCGEPAAKPKLVSRPTPAYTDDARASGVAGKVRVEITVDERGKVTSVRLVQGLGHGLDEAALSAARAMTFEPAMRCGKAEAATFKVGFNFAPPSP